MKKCPYCTEEIMEEAIFCRYCTRRVRGRYNHLIFVVVIMSIIASLYLLHKKETDRAVRNFIREFSSTCRSIGQIIKEIPDIAKNIKKNNSDKAEIINSILQSSAK